MKIKKPIDQSNRPPEKKPERNLGEHFENFYIDTKVEMLREFVTEINLKIESLLARKKS